MMITLRDKATGTRLGSISESDLRFLIDALEEEERDDQDYWIDAATVDMLAEDGASAELVETLRAAVSGGDGLDVVWSRD